MSLCENGVMFHCFAGGKMTIMPDSPDIENKCWHALSAPYRRELKAKQFLDERGIENFIPMRYSVVTRRSGEKLRKLMPAVRNLVFAKASREVMKDLKSEAAFLQYRTMRCDGRNVPITIPDREMENFISACKTHDENMVFLSPDEIDLRKGTRVRIIGGPLDGVEGIFVRVKGSRSKKVVVLVTGLAAVVPAEVSPDLIEVLPG